MASFEETLSEAEEASVGSEEEHQERVASSDESEGEDLFDNENLLRSDYQPRPDLDHYDQSLLDDSNRDHQELHPAQRRQVERFLDTRDALLGRQPPRGTSRLAAAFKDVLPTAGVEEEEDEEDEIWRVLRARRERLRGRAEQAERFPVQEAEQAKEELPHCRGVGSWTDRVAEVLEVVFSAFLCLFQRQPGSGARVATYTNSIEEMAHHDITSFTVLWNDLRTYCPKILDWIYYCPQQSFSVFNLAATTITKQRFPQLYNLRKVTVRLRGYEVVDSLQRLKTSHLNTLICVRGVVIRRTNVQPRLRLLYFECHRCGCDSIGPYEKRDGDRLRVKLICEDCQSVGPFRLCREKTLYENYQTLTIQEPPGQVTPGYIPKQKQVIICGDLVDSARPGDEVVITGIYQTRPDARLNATSGFPIFSTQIIANNLERQVEVKMTEITEEDLEIIHKLSRNPNIREKIIDSIAPSIWGHRHTKTGLAYAMIGGVGRQTAAGHTVRGDINFLILGDPGVGKSQFLKYVEKTFDRTIYTTGKGSSAVGLTASVRRDERTGEWVLEGGALVIADEGICLIDEFDKMAEQDRVSIHEAMEQQTISISKAGIVATLKARCSIIAAANPIYGRYDNSLNFNENVDLSSPILSRFDILSVVKDQVHPITDEHLAEHVVNSHYRGHPKTSHTHSDPTQDDADMTAGSNGASISITDDWITNAHGKIPQELLRKYILYSRRHCFPSLQRQDSELVARFYSEIRQASLSVSSGIPMTVRHLESIVRMASANARMRLSSTVDKRDMLFAIGTMVESFIQSQKYAIAVQLGKRFGRYRALASSPEEFIESILTDELSRNTKKIMVTHQGLLQNAIASAKVPLHQLVCVRKALSLFNDPSFQLVHSMYNLPEAAVKRYVQTQRFLSRFAMQEIEGDQVIRYATSQRPIVSSEA